MALLITFAIFLGFFWGLLGLPFIVALVISTIGAVGGALVVGFLNGFRGRPDETHVHYHQHRHVTKVDVHQNKVDARSVHLHNHEGDRKRIGED